MIISQNNTHSLKRKGILNLYGERDGPLGVVKLNREHRYNTLSPSMVQDVTRGVDTMNNCHISHAIYLGTEKGEHFCNGTDFNTIAHMKKEDNIGRI